MRRTDRNAPKAERIYLRLRDAILSGRLKPGVYLRERELAARFRVSRTPIREALRQLERDGQIRLTPHLGAEVKEVSLQDLLEVLEMRRYLEPYSARNAARRITPQAASELRKIRRTFEAPPPRGLTPSVIDAHIRADRRLHELILELAGNTRIMQALVGLSLSIQRYRYFGIGHRFQRSANEHIALIDALLDRDPGASEASVVRHLEQFTEDVRRLFVPKAGADVG